MSLFKSQNVLLHKPPLLILPLCLLFLLSSFIFVQSKPCQVQGIFNFGDSNSDTGGFWAAFPAQNGPFGMTYFKRPAGRASDGRLVIDFLAEAFGLPFLSPYLQSIGSNFKHGANFATLASTVLLPNTSLFVSGISPFSLAIQLNQMKDFKNRLLQLHPTGHLPSRDIFTKSLYTIDIGQNDFTSNIAKIGIEGVQQYLPQVISQINYTIKELYELGGRLFLIFNLAPIGCFPAFLSELPHNHSDYGCMVSYNNAVDDYNRMLNKSLRQTRNELQDAFVVYIDTSSVKLELFRQPQKHGFAYGTKACCGEGGGDLNFNPEVFCGNTKMINGTMVKAVACDNPERYVSWDGIHSTEAANKVVAMAVLNGSYSEPPLPLSKLCHLHRIG